jgi:hypothetical protein
MSQFNYEAVPQFICNGCEAANVSTHGMEYAVHALNPSWAIVVDSDAGGGDTYLERWVWILRWYW